MRRFVLGDIHGSFLALRQVLTRSAFNYDEDRLIFLGDVCDGWPELDKCLDELMKVKKLVFIRGNHDQWFLEYLDKILAPDGINSWELHGGNETKDLLLAGKITAEHIDFLKSSIFYHAEDEMLFVHAGHTPKVPIEEQNPFMLMWDRTLVKNVYSYRLKPSINDFYNEVFVGHTPLQSFNSRKFDPTTPQKFCDVWLMDTGCAFNGVLSLMDIDSKEVYRSETSASLYPDHRGRNRQTYNEKREIGL